MGVLARMDFECPLYSVLDFRLGELSIAEDKCGLTALRLVAVVERHRMESDVSRSCDRDNPTLVGSRGHGRDKVQTRSDSANLPRRPRCQHAHERIAPPSIY